MAIDTHVNISLFLKTSNEIRNTREAMDREVEGSTENTQRRHYLQQRAFVLKEKQGTG